MKLTGIIHSIGGFHTIRGFAPLADIAKVSKAEDFQRNLIPEHKQEIKAFYRRNQDLFFPELVLAHTLKYDFTKEDAISGTDPIRNITIDFNEFESNIDAIKFKPLKTEIGKQRVVEIIIEDEWLKNNQPFSRIDGNHRISAYLEENERNPLNHFNAPFCIILLSDNSKNMKSKKIIFHNINSKARRLTTEEELKGIILNDDFSDDELKQEFGWAYLATRQISEQLPDNLNQVYNHIGTAFSSKPLTILINVCKALEKNPNLDKQGIICHSDKALQEINQLLGNNPKLTNNCNMSIVTALFYIAISKQGDLDLFLKWVLKNNINELDSLNPISLIDIYSKIREAKSKQIFVSMQFDEATKPHYEAIKKAVNEVNDEHNLDIKLREIRIDEFNQGHSYKIDDEILTLIEESGLLICDLSAKNVNVYQELGYLMGLNQGKGLKQENFILIKKEDENSKDTDIGFNIRPFQQLRFKDTLSLVKLLKQAIKEYYQLN